MHFLILQQFFPRAGPLCVWVSLSDQWLNTVEADTQYQLDTARKVLLALGGEGGLEGPWQLAVNQHVSSLWMLLCKGLETSGAFLGKVLEEEGVVTLAVTQW